MDYFTINKAERCVEQNTTGNFAITYGNITLSGTVQIIAEKDSKLEIIAIDDDFEILIGSK